jgi:peroxiredoxin
MRLQLAVVIALALVVGVVAAGLVATGQRGDGEPPVPVTAGGSDEPATRVPPPPPPPAAAPRPRRGRAFPLAEAMKELDLVRPSRLKRAEDFTVKTPGGGAFRLADHRGKVVMVNFWATWCPPCLEEMPAMERLYRQHREAGFTLVAVSVDGDDKVVPPFVKKLGLTFPIGLDPGMDLANAYGVRALPSSFLVDREGNLVALAIGPRHWDDDASHSLVEGLVR